MFDDIDSVDIDDINEDIDFIFSSKGLLSKIKKDYLPREQQINASKSFMKALSENSHAIAELPCGSGKTFAYLVPAMTSIINSNSRVVIATNGISLQEQLFYKDLPLMQRMFYSMYSQNITYAMLKGKSNYLCKNKISIAVSTNSIIDPVAREIINLHKNKKIKNGDISNLDFVPNFDALSEVACVDDGECLGKSCSFYNDCYYQKTKVKSLESDVVVVNYHMLFSDLSIGGAILGKYDVVIFDEAHEIRDVYRDFLEEKVSLGSFVYIRNKISELSKKDETLRNVFIKEIKFDLLLQVAEDFFEKVKKTLFINGDKDDIKVMDETIPLCMYDTEIKSLENGIEHIEDKLLEIMLFYIERMDQLILEYGSEDNMLKSDKEDYNNYKIIANTTNGLIARLNRIKRLTILYKDTVSDERFVYWVENKDSKISLSIKPITVADEMYDNFFSKEGLSCILTSATLSTGGNFKYMKNQLGMDMDGVSSRVIELIGESPFDLKNQELWYLPSDAVDGDSRNSKQFREIIPKQIAELLSISDGGALCLFTSYSNLNGVYDDVRRALPDHKLLKQGDLPRTKLVESFRDDKDSSLFATRSFFTGVDVPGDSLRCLIIDKLPFPSPADPIMIKLQKLYGTKTFSKHFMPEMIILLKQAVGRGVRSVDDRCLIVILDGRMASATSYNKIIFSSFPYDKTGTRDINDVKEFYRNKK